MARSDSRLVQSLSSAVRRRATEDVPVSLAREVSLGVFNRRNGSVVQFCMCAHIRRRRSRLTRRRHVWMMIVKVALVRSFDAAATIGPFPTNSTLC